MAEAAAERYAMPNFDEMDGPEIAGSLMKTRQGQELMYIMNKAEQEKDERGRSQRIGEMSLRTTQVGQSMMEQVKSRHQDQAEYYARAGKAGPGPWDDPACKPPRRRKGGPGRAGGSSGGGMSLGPGEYDTSAGMSEEGSIVDRVCAAMAHRVGERGSSGKGEKYLNAELYGDKGNVLGVCIPSIATLSDAKIIMAADSNFGLSSCKGLYDVYGRPVKTQVGHLYFSSLLLFDVVNMKLKR